MNILWIVGLYLVCGLAAGYGLSKVSNYFINKAYVDYWYNGILMEINNKVLAVAFVITTLVAWPVVYLVLETRVIIKYLMAKRNWMKEQEEMKMIDNLVERLSA